jgi:dethiobiotin synthetase
LKRLFITSTGTGIGKTYVTCALIRQARALGKEVAATKPLISGYDKDKIAESDTGAILGALGQDVTEANADKISPWRFSAPLAPNMAAAAEGRAVDCAALFKFSVKFLAQPADVALIEGVGGLMAPLDDEKTVVDWSLACGVPVLLVVGDYLGTISHTLTAVEVLKMRGVAIAAVVVSEGLAREVPFAETLADLAARLPVPVLPLRRGATGESLAVLLWS